MQNNKYTILFSLALCLILSVLLSGVYMLLKDQQELNKRIDKQKNILEAAQIKVVSNDEVEEIYTKLVEPLVVSRTTGKIHKKANFEEALEASNNKNNKSDLLPIFRILDSKNQTKSYVYPIVGTGLWSTLFGYLAVTPDGKNIVGITFYKQGETPGLGAEIVQPWFREAFVGKTLYKGDKVEGVIVSKGKAKDSPLYKTDSDRMVDGISGATITGDGVMRMLDLDPEKYAKFFAEKNHD